MDLENSTSVTRVFKVKADKSPIGSHSVRLGEAARPLPSSHETDYG